jgi:ADP-heptose:LPS heptosyltransferase
MKASSYRDKWSVLKKKGCDPGELKRLSHQIAYSFLDHYLKNCGYEEDYIDLLCEITTFSEDSKFGNPGAQALFGIIVETLCDDFEELQTATYNKVMAQVISYCRNIPAGKKLDLTLRHFGIYSEKDLLDRIANIRANGTSLPHEKQIRKILLLSRVTIGADVAITSVIIQRLSKAFPRAEMVLIGENKLKEIYQDNPSIRIRKVPYSKKGGLLERLSSWHVILRIVEEELSTCPLERTILLDPDSRLTQLGILPVIPLDQYFFFDSRSDTSLNRKMSMAELTNSWLNTIVGKDDFCYPKVWIPRSYLDHAERFCENLRNNGAERIIVVNFGVGGNLRKRLGRRLEEKLLLTLLKEPKTVIILDKGYGEKEAADIGSLTEVISEHGHGVEHSAFGSVKLEKLGPGLIGVTTRIGEIAALIAKSDEFIGYDSACQHIAAALGTPCLTIFAGSNNMRFIRRWSAYGRRSCDIVHVDTLTNPGAIDVENITARIMHVRDIRNH